MNPNEKLTAEEIIEKHTTTKYEYVGAYKQSYKQTNYHSAMREFATQETRPLLDKIEEYKDRYEFVLKNAKQLEEQNGIMIRLELECQDKISELQSKVEELEKLVELGYVHAKNIEAKWKQSKRDFNIQLSSLRDQNKRLMEGIDKAINGYEDCYYMCKYDFDKETQLETENEICELKQLLNPSTK